MAHFAKCRNFSTSLAQANTANFKTHDRVPGLAMRDGNDLTLLCMHRGWGERGWACCAGPAEMYALRLIAGGLPDGLHLLCNR